MIDIRLKSNKKEYLLLVCLLFVLFMSARGYCKSVQYVSEAIGGQDEMVWYDAAESPFRLYGVYPPSEKYPYYYRMPESAAEAVSPMVKSLSLCTAGGRVRFTTDSPYLAVHCEEWQGGPYQHMPHLNVAGFSIYVQKPGGKPKYHSTFFSDGGFDGYDGVHGLTGDQETVTLYMPLYGGVKKLYIGVKKGSMLKPAPDYTNEKPVVFYGSSITQGGCASRPGNSYQGILSRELDMNYINLGFSGSALGEQNMANYIAGLNMSAFVLDYDHNAPSAEHYRNTHYQFYKTIRKAHPEIPIIFVSRPVVLPSSEEQERINIIADSYRKALEEGDKNVYVVFGTSFFEGIGAGDWSVDGTHPNDFGFVMMARKIHEVLKPLMK